LAALGKSTARDPGLVTLLSSLHQPSSSLHQPATSLVTPSSSLHQPATSLVTPSSSLHQPATSLVTPSSSLVTPLPSFDEAAEGLLAYICLPKWARIHDFEVLDRKNGIEPSSPY
jgi:hypothetical protein